MKYGFAISDRALEEIFQAFDPQSFKRSYKLYREIPFKKFPYLIVYFIVDFKGRIVVTSVFHTSLNPDTKFD